MSTPAQIEIIPGVAGPTEFMVDNWTLGSGHAVRMAIKFDTDARTYVCDEIRVGRDESVSSPVGPVTTDVLRDISVGQMIRVQLLVKDGGDRHLRDLPNPGDREPWGRKLPDGLKSEGPTDRVLRWVAHWYRLAIALGDAPTKAVQDDFGIPRTTAIRWVMAAREKGHLGPAEAGKRGEGKG